MCGMIYDEPIFFEKNRVFRIYTGGRLLGEFVGDGSPDSSYPEEWIASDVKAQKSREHGEKEGVSRVRGTQWYLDDLLRKYPREILGEKKELGVLVKFLDSSIRLAAQAHPDSSYAQKYFGSTHGKEESWVVLAKRPGGCVYFGFQEGVTRAQFAAAIARSAEDKHVMETLLVRHEVEPGDVIFVPARTVHAIGAGCLMLEVQEPTDFTIEPEHWCGNFRLTEEEMYLGLDQETALDCFDFTVSREVKLAPAVLEARPGLLAESLIGPRQTRNFGVNRITLSGGAFVPRRDAGIYVVTGGTGEITGPGCSQPLRQGMYFLLPHAAAGKFTISGSMTVMECFAE